MIIDGQALAANIYDSLAEQIEEMNQAPHLTIFTCSPNLATQKYLALKKKKSALVGVGINVIEFPPTCTTEEMVQTIRQAQMQTDGIIVQLPLPLHVDTKAVLEAVPGSYDVDAMHYDGTEKEILPPVVGAIAEICQAHDVLLATQQVVVVGHGLLVGQPAAIWAQRQGAHVTVLTKETSEVELKASIAHADIIILGAGQPGMVTSDMVKEGVLIFDAGAAEESGVLRGDADPACAPKASLFTPVPGGIGPLTVALLLRNLTKLTARQ